MKKKSDHIWQQIFLPILICACLLCCMIFDTFDQKSSFAGNEFSVKSLIVLDPGHGGEDGGASGSGLVEKDLNLKIACILRDYLKGAGFSVVMTREDDRLLCEPDTPKGHRKQGDLSKRLSISESYSEALLVSIHMNSYPGVPCSGLQVWYSGNHSASAEIAQSVQGSVKTLLQPTNNRKIKMATSGIYLLRNSQNPAILIECGFLSNPAECEKLANEGYLQDMALAIFAGIVEKI